MSKIVIEVETNPKTLSVTVDGEIIENISDINIERFEDFNGEETIFCTFVTREVDRENKIAKRTVFSTIGSSFAKKALATKNPIKHPLLPNFVGYILDTKEQIKAWFSES